MQSVRQKGTPLCISGASTAWQVPQKGGQQTTHVDDQQTVRELREAPILGIGNRLPDEALSTPGTDEPKAEKPKKKQPSVNFVPEEPKYELGDIILPQGVRDDILDVPTMHATVRSYLNSGGLVKHINTQNAWESTCMVRLERERQWLLMPL